MVFRRMCSPACLVGKISHLPSILVCGSWMLFLLLLFSFLFFCFQAALVHSLKKKEKKKKKKTSVGFF